MTWALHLLGGGLLIFGFAVHGVYRWVRRRLLWRAIRRDVIREHEHR